jgi:hypothetical protein
LLCEPVSTSDQVRGHASLENAISYSKDIIGVGLTASAGWLAEVSIRFRNQNTAEKEKGPTRVGPVTDQLFYDRPDPDDPGGLGAEESGAERTGPT